MYMHLKSQFNSQGTIASSRVLEVSLSLSWGRRRRPPRNWCSGWSALCASGRTRSPSRGPSTLSLVEKRRERVRWSSSNLKTCSNRGLFQSCWWGFEDGKGGFSPPRLGNWWGWKADRWLQSRSPVKGLDLNWKYFDVEIAQWCVLWFWHIFYSYLPHSVSTYPVLRARLYFYSFSRVTRLLYWLHTMTHHTALGLWP